MVTSVNMGIYSTYVFPRLLDWAMGVEELVPLRRELLAAAAGETVEVGFGTGANFPFYSNKVKRLVGIEKDQAVAKLAEVRRGQFSGEMVLKQGMAEKLPLESRSVDCVVTTLTLCSCADVFKALNEIRRVLKPGGIYLFLEHGLSHEPSVQKWQRRLTPIQKVIGCGCHFNRNIRGFLADACLETTECRSFYIDKSPKFAGFFTMGKVVV